MASPLTAQELAISGRILLASASLLPSAASTPSPDEPILPPDALSTAFEGTETCPACKAAISFANIRKAACSNGHQWGAFRNLSLSRPPPRGLQKLTSLILDDGTERCSITLAVVASVQVRTCTSCERKALIKLVPEPTSGSGGEGAGNSVEVINGILKTTTCCLYCGGRWMRIR